MPLLLRLGFRNIWRHKKRSLITLAAIAVGLGALIFLRGFMFGAQRQMVKNLTRTLTSDAQIVPAALENFYNTNGAIEDPDPIRAILNEDRRVLAYAERIVGGGMVASEKKSMGTYIIGLDPEAEERIDARREVVRGRGLAPGGLANTDETSVIVGEKMRQALEIEVGDPVVLTAQDYYSSLAAGSYTVVGSFETGNDQVDNTMVILLKSSAQKLLSFEHRISKFALKIDPDHSLQEVTSDLARRLGGPDLKVVTWETLVPMIAQMIRFQNGMIFVIMAIVLSAVAVGILNTLMMSILERIREFGLMMALGMRPRSIVRLVLIESLCLGLVGTLSGWLLGAVLVFYFGHVGIDLTRFTTALSNLMIGRHVFPRLDLSYSLIFAGVVVVSNLLISLYPAWKAGRLAPLESMRQAG